MFSPSRKQVRQFFCGVWQKHHAHAVLSPLEVLALKWVLAHPEYHALLADEPTALTQEFDTSAGNSNPFLHLAMHLSITEQISIDQPPGIRYLYTVLTQKLNSEHEGQHHVMDCLEEMLWRAQKNNVLPDSEAYLDCIQNKVASLS